MSKHVPSADNKNMGSYLWRGGKRIELEKESDRFTLHLSDPKLIEALHSLPGVEDIQPVTSQVYKVKTTDASLDQAMAALRSDEYGAVAHHAYHPKGSADTVYYLTDKIIVRFIPEASTAEINALLEKYHLNTVEQYDWLPQTYLLQVTDESGANPLKIANNLMEESAVASAEPDLVNRFQKAFIPNDDLFPKQWHLNASQGINLLAEASINAPEAWDVTLGDRSIVVAVIDDGFDLDHPDFKHKIVSPINYVDGNDQPYPDADGFHGTPCAGVAIADCNGAGVVGVAPGCSFMPVRFPFNAEESLLIKIFKEVGSQSDVISCSWKLGPFLAPLSEALDGTLKHIATEGGRRGKGCVICFAAGNNNLPIKDLEPKSFQWFDYANGVIRTTTGAIENGMAAHPDVIAVAASTSLNKHAAYSNWGAEVNVCAPSNNFNPLTNEQLTGLSIWTTDNEAIGRGFTDGSRYTDSFGGTSSATPVVAGTAALILSANPELSAAAVKEILQTTADKILDVGSDIFGMNRSSYDDKGHCDWFGFGKVNAAKAVREAIKRRT